MVNDACLFWIVPFGPSFFEVRRNFLFKTSQPIIQNLKNYIYWARSSLSYEIFRSGEIKIKCL